MLLIVDAAAGGILTQIWVVPQTKLLEIGQGGRMRIYQSKKGRAMQHITVQPDKTKNFVRWSRERTPRLIASHDKATNFV